MPADWREQSTRRSRAEVIDSTVPQAARVANYLDGGRDNFEADRKAAQAIVAAAPVIASIVPAWHAFLMRVTRYLVREAGVRQFLHVATSLAASNYADEYVWSVDPGCRLVFVGRDPQMLAHARALMRPEPAAAAGYPDGAIGYVEADMRDADMIVAGARPTLDFSQPVAVTLAFVLCFIADTAEAAHVVSSLVDAVPSGSHVVIHHPASELDPALAKAVRQWNRGSAQPVTLRSRDEVASLVAGLDLVPPGLVPIDEWRPARSDPRSDAVIPMHGLVARKP